MTTCFRVTLFSRVESSSSCRSSRCIRVENNLLYLLFLMSGEGLCCNIGWHTSIDATLFCTWRIFCIVVSYSILLFSTRYPWHFVFCSRASFSLQQVDSVVPWSSCTSFREAFVTCGTCLRVIIVSQMFTRGRWRGRMSSSVSILATPSNRLNDFWWSLITAGTHKICKGRQRSYKQSIICKDGLHQVCC